ncbi:MAG: RNA polymerase sigma factor [Ignavibacteriales bacterium]|nr:RNA polymerase sigma factor [Ignavibacteriales bacterium]
MQVQISNDELIELIEKAKSGEVRAFEKIVVSYQRYCLAVSFRILCNEDDAKEIVQECFIRIWKHLKSYDSRSKFTTWMYKIIVNLCYDRLKSKRRYKWFEKSNEDIFEPEFVSSTDIEREFTNKETVMLIKYFSNQLSEKQRIIFVLRDIEELSIKEVAKVTGMAEASVKTNLFFARQNIRKKIIGLEK